MDEELLETLRGRDTAEPAAHDHDVPTRRNTRYGDRPRQRALADDARPHRVERHCRDSAEQDGRDEQRESGDCLGDRPSRACRRRERDYREPHRGPPQEAEQEATAHCGGEALGLESKEHAVDGPAGYRDSQMDQPSDGRRVES
ncbi:MAG: hypothetical protein L0221_06215, partial [Chloroflexi bacterium]|nr:hypothetical protein [Chloroflexota bacterium]